MIEARYIFYAFAGVCLGFTLSALRDCRNLRRQRHEELHVGNKNMSIIAALRIHERLTQHERRARVDAVVAFTLFCLFSALSCVGTP
jgi:hypothetical protein